MASIVLFFLVITTSHLAYSLPQVKVDPKVWENLEAEKVTDVFVHFRDRKLEEIRENFRRLQFPSREAKLNGMYDLLKGNADTGQERVVKFLGRFEVKYHQLWIINSIVIYNVNKALVNALAKNYPEVEFVEADREFSHQFSRVVKSRGHDGQILGDVGGNSGHIGQSSGQNYDSSGHSGQTSGHINNRIFGPIGQKIRESSNKIGQNKGNYDQSSAFQPKGNQLLQTNWAIDKVRSNLANSYGCDGRNVVVSNIDTGVLWTNTALINQYRGDVNNHDYNWFDATGTSLNAPSDNVGHGTSTMSIICGSNNLGHAPSAKWIACKACTDVNCSNSNILICAQWISCPTNRQGQNKDCSKAPHIVSNSFNVNSFNNAYMNQVVDTWNAMGILSFFAIGNSGGSGKCDTTLSPGNQPGLISVGASDEMDGLAPFSGVGPGVGGITKPEVVAPGTNIPAAFIPSDTSTIIVGGTSMATPCVAAMAALVLSIRPELEPNKVYQIIQNGCVNRASNQICAPTDSQTFNNQFGHGRVDAVNICDNAAYYP